MKKSDTALTVFAKQRPAGANPPWWEKHAEMWRQEKRAWAFVDTFSPPCSCGDWGPYVADGFPPPRRTPGKRSVSIALIGGGDITVTENWHAYGPWLSDDGWIFDTQIGRAWPLELTADFPYNTYSYMWFHGELVRTSGVASAVAVVTKPMSEHEKLAERFSAAAVIARSLRLIGRRPEHFHAMLGGVSRNRCGICDDVSGSSHNHLELKTDLERALGVTEQCARKFNIPFSQEAAARRLALRLALLTPHPERDRAGESTA